MALRRNRKVARVLFISSGGGHWVELLRLRPAFKEFDQHFCSVRREYREDVHPDQFYPVTDATQDTIMKLIFLALQTIVVVIKVRPQIVVSTGAAPGYFGIRMGKMLGAKTIWLDSFANVNHMSRSGLLAKKYSDLWLSQWPEVADAVSAGYLGKVF